MNQTIADIIRTQIEATEATWIDKTAGLVSSVTIETRGPDNITIQKTFPVACCVTAKDCKSGAYNELMPDSKYKSVLYFEDKGIVFKESKGNFKYYTSNLRLVGWLNINKILGKECNCSQICNYAAVIVAEIIRALPVHASHISPFSHVLTEITEQEPRTSAIFSKYTYDEVHSQYLMAPYDYFALNLKTDFAICLNGNAITPVC